MDDSGAHHTAEAFFEMKIYTAHNSRYNYNESNKITNPPDRRAKKIISAYNKKIKELDEVFTEEVVGSRESGITGPFQMTQG